MRLNKRHVALRRFWLDDDRLKLGKIFGSDQLVLQIFQFDTQTVRDCRQVFINGVHIIAQ